VSRVSFSLVRNRSRNRGIQLLFIDIGKEEEEEVEEGATCCCCSKEGGAALKDLWKRSMSAKNRSPGLHASKVGSIDGAVDGGAGEEGMVGWGLEDGPGEDGIVTAARMRLVKENRATRRRKLKRWRVQSFKGNRNNDRTIMR